MKTKPINKKIKQKLLQLLLVAFCMLLTVYGYSQQGVSINITGTPADNSAMLDVSSTSKGLLIPRVILTSINDVATIPSPAISLLVYNTNAGMTGGGVGYWYWDGTQWVQAIGPQGPTGPTGATGATGATGPVGCSNNNYVIKSNGSSAACSIIYDDGTNVGIGTTVPSAKLEVTGYVMLNDGNDDGTRLIWRGGTGGTQEYRARVYSTGYLGFFPIEVGNPGYVGDVLTLTQAGNVGIGNNTNPFYTLDVYGSTSCTSGFWDASDVRFKKNITPITYALSKVLKLQGVTYYWRKEEFKEFNFGDSLQYGVIAQELEKVIPELVNSNAKGYKSVEYSKLTPVLVEAIKEQQEMIDSLKLSVGLLTEEYKSLQSAVGSLQTENQNLKLEIEKQQTTNDKQQTEIEKIKQQLGIEAKK